MADKFPITKAGHIFNSFSNKKKSNPELVLSKIEINYPCRLDAMAINPAAVADNLDMIFEPGEVVISIKKFIKVKIKVINEVGGIIKISPSTKRKVLVKHSYLLMCDALMISPSLEIDVDDNDIPKHSGFGTSSSIIAAVAASINELYGCPIGNGDLIKYLASNHGEEVNDNDEDNLKAVQCIGGGATNGLTKEGIIIITGRATTIAKMKYEGEVLICIPKDFKPKDAKVLMELEEKNLWKFKKTGNMYSDKIAYNILHKALPGIANGSIKELSEVVYDYRFNMGSNENCSFVYEGLVNIGNKLRILYENKDCEFLALSSVGPAFFVIINSKEQKEKCLKKMKELNMTIIQTSVFNRMYSVCNRSKIENFWQNKNTNIEFTNKLPSRYITDEIDKLIVKDKDCIDIGCGAGRYSKYLKSIGAKVLSIDKYPEMVGNADLNFIKAPMHKIPVKNSSYYLTLSIGVIHNSTTEIEFIKALKEIYRILKKDGYAILSTFTNDVITDDLIKYSNNLYFIKDRPPMILLSKKQIEYYIRKIGFNIIKVVDEHITDVGSGKRYVYSLLLKK